MYYPCSENKGTDQLRSYCAADLHLYFRICKKTGFLMTWLNYYTSHSICSRGLIKIVCNVWLLTFLFYSSSAQIFPPGVFSTQLESKEKECLLSVIDINPDGKIVVLDSNNATLKIYDKSSFKFPFKKEHCTPRYGIEAMAMLTNE